MADMPGMGTIPLMRDLLRQVSQLLDVEGRLFRAEMREAGQKAASGLTLVAAALVLSLVGLGCISAALVLVAARFMPADAACALVGVVAFVICIVLVLVARSRLKPSGLLPVRTINQVSSALEGLGK